MPVGSTVGLGGRKNHCTDRTNAAESVQPSSLTQRFGRLSVTTSALQLEPKIVFQSVNALGRQIENPKRQIHNQAIDHGRLTIRS